MNESTDAVEGVVADALGIPETTVTDDLSFRSIPQWDSLRHVELMLALEEHWRTEIGADLVLELNSVRAIKDFANANGGSAPRQPTTHPDGQAVRRGLSGVHVDETRISHIDGGAGRLAYRGYSIDDLVRYSSFEETTYLLLFGELPTAEQLEAFDRRLKAARTLPPGVRDVLEQLKDAHPMDALRTGVSALSAFDPDSGDRSAEGMLRTGIRLIAQIPMIVGAHHGIRSGRDPSPSTQQLPHAAHVLTLLTGRQPSERDASILDRALILLSEHGSNASAFAARVVIGTGSDLHAAVTAALAAFAGPLHGGAIQGVTEMIKEVGEPSRAADYVRALRARDEPVLGLGHRLYNTEDPRAPHLREMARDLSRDADDMTPYLILEEVREAMHPYARHGIDVNVDFYAGLVFSLLGIPSDLLTPVFVVGRIVGWAAQSLEQRNNNVLIRPLLRYVGNPNRDYTPIRQR